MLLGCFKEQTACSWFAAQREKFSQPFISIDTDATFVFEDCVKIRSALKERAREFTSHDIKTLQKLQADLLENLTRI